MQKEWENVSRYLVRFYTRYRYVLCLYIIGKLRFWSFIWVKLHFCRSISSWDMLSISCFLESISAISMFAISRVDCMVKCWVLSCSLKYPVPNYFPYYTNVLIHTRAWKQGNDGNGSDNSGNSHTGKHKQSWADANCHFLCRPEN